MTWSRYGQLLTFTDCSGYQTRYEYGRFGQVTALHQEEGLSQYRAYDDRADWSARKMHRAMRPDMSTASRAT